MASLQSARLETFATGEEVADAVAAWLLRLALASKGRFSLNLSGGSTPKVLYGRLAQKPYAKDFPWGRTHLFFGDERFVPKDNKDSNFHMVSDALLSHVHIPDENVHRIVTEVPSAEAAASRYEGELTRFYGADTLDPERPLFDVTLLGLGPDGHTASLLPGQPVLDERRRWVAAVEQGRPEKRITLTYPVLESSRHVAFLVVGQDKAAMLAHIRSGATDVPAGRLDTPGEVLWFIDQAAVNTQGPVSPELR